MPSRHERRIGADILAEKLTIRKQQFRSVCSSGGKLLSAKIARSSDNPAWDAAALKVVQRLEPIPRALRVRHHLVRQLHLLGIRRTWIDVAWPESALGPSPLRR
ncbi:energy transducer TonB family protein [Burkholderia gladioli]|uniref:energy transducer TonB family protein n=1 Tax=Burkholderia gladioli TaxID=28095 RepID=UPI00163F4068|nr:energy transducer TonB [Burkholderia gladioli]